MKSLRIAVSVAVLSTLFACPPDPKVVAEKTAKDTSSLIREAWQSAEQTNDWQSVDKFFEGTFGVRRGRTENTSAIYVPAVSNFDTGSDVAGKSLGRVFDKSNVVKTEGGAVYFNVRGVDVCVGNDGVVNTSCADTIDGLTPQLKVSGDLDIAVLLGTNHVEAAVFHLVSKKSIAIDLDLAHANDVAQIMQRAFNPNQEPFLSGTASGKLQLKLEKNKDFDFSVSVSLLSDLNLSWNTTSMASRSYFLQARSPAVQVRVDAPSRRITAKLDFGNGHYTGKGEEFGLAQAATSTIDASLAGLTADFLFDDSNYQLNNVSLGGTTSTLKSGSTTMLQVDLNAALGRKVDLAALETTDGLRVTAKPGLVIDATTNFGALDDFDFHVSEELRNSKYSFSFTSTGTPTLDFFLRRIANGESGMPVARLADGTIKVKVDSLSPGTADNLAVCNAMKNHQYAYGYGFDCGGNRPVPIDCDSVPINEFENNAYMNCVVFAYTCDGNGNYVLDQTARDSCQLRGDRSVPEVTFDATTCLGSNQSGTNNMVGFFTGTVACP